MKKLPLQKHHWLTDKHKKYTPDIKKITDKYRLDLNGAWNKEYMPHRGRHPNRYHEFVYDSIEEIDKIANGNKNQFLKLLEKHIKDPIRKNPEKLRKSGWQ